jgi:hypothetical protein
VLALCILAGCASVPESSLPNVMSVQIQDLATLDSAAIRAAMELDVPVVPDMNPTRLALKIERKDGTIIAWLFRLKPLPREAPEYGLLPKPAEGRRWFVLELTPESALEFSNLKNRMLEEPQLYLKLHFSIETGYEMPPRRAVEHFRMQILLQLVREKGFVPLVKETWI